MTSHEKQIDLGTDKHAKGSNFVPLLPGLGSDCPKRQFPGHGPDTGSVSAGSPPAGALNTKRPSHEHREQAAEPAAQEKNVRLKSSKSVRRYEWPLIINGVYQGAGPLPSCRIEENESSTEPEPYAWPLIILHQARFQESYDQQQGPSGKEAKGDTAEKEERFKGVDVDDKSTDESTMTDGVTVER